MGNLYRQKAYLKRKGLLPTSAETEMVAGVDQYNGYRVVVYDQNSLINEKPTVVWEWSATHAKGYEIFDRPGTNGGTTAGAALSDAKLRYSDYYDRYVVAITCSQGYTAVIDYETQECLYEVIVDAINPHAVELFEVHVEDNIVPMLAVASSNGNAVTLYNLAEGGTSQKLVEYSLDDAHGVLWDPDLQRLWALGDLYLVGYDMSEAVVQNAEIFNNADRQPEVSYSVPGGSGHDLYPVYGEPGKLWITALLHVYQFDIATGTFSEQFAANAYVTGEHNKSMGTQPFSGTIVRVYPPRRKADGTPNRAWRTDTIELFIPDGNGGYTKKSHAINGAGFYKARTWWPEYK